MRAALAAVDAGGLVRAALATTPDVVRTVQSAAAIDVVAVGKAARPMVLALPAALPRAAFRHVHGISNQPAEGLPSGVQWHVTAHPVPDSRSVGAARAALAVAAAAGDRDLLLVLVSGGASAMMALPADGISLDDKRRTSQQLLDAGAEVHALNAVRKHLSGIKGGQLAAATRGADPHARRVRRRRRRAVRDRLRTDGGGFDDVCGRARGAGAIRRTDARTRQPSSSGSWTAHSGAHPETPKPGDARLARSFVHVIGSARTAVDGARAAAERLGYAVHVVDEPVIGEARAAGQTLIETAARLGNARTAGGDAACILAAGETTVRVTGSGKGGRNQECALGMVRGLNTFGRQASPPASAQTASTGRPTPRGPLSIRRRCRARDGGARYAGTVPRQQ